MLGFVDLIKGDVHFNFGEQSKTHSNIAKIWNKKGNLKNGVTSKINGVNLCFLDKL